VKTSPLFSRIFSTVVFLTALVLVAGVFSSFKEIIPSESGVNTAAVITAFTGTDSNSNSSARPTNCYLTVKIKEYLGKKLENGQQIDAILFSLINATPSITRVRHRIYPYYEGEEADYSLDAFGEDGKLIGKYSLYSTLFPIIEGGPIVILPEGTIETIIPLTSDTYRLAVHTEAGSTNIWRNTSERFSCPHSRVNSTVVATTTAVTQAPPPAGTVASTSSQRGASYNPYRSGTYDDVSQSDEYNFSDVDASDDSFLDEYDYPDWDTYDDFSFDDYVPPADENNENADSATIPKPTVSLRVAPTEITNGGEVKLTWITVDATTCSASSPNGLWTGAKPKNNSEGVVVKPVNSGTSPIMVNYTLTCTNSAGNTSGTASVRINPTQITTATPPTTPTVTVISPSSGHAGIEITITGVNFAPTGNVIQFSGGGRLIPFANISSSDGKTLKFTAPNSSLGNYKIAVSNDINGFGSLSSALFTLTAPPPPPPPPPTVTQTSVTNTTSVTSSGPTIISTPPSVVVPAPTATLTVEGQKSFIYNITDTTHYAWSSTNADTFTSSFSFPPSSVVCASGAWSIGTAQGTKSNTITSDLASCVWTITYTAKNSKTGQSASDSVTVTVANSTTGGTSTGGRNMSISVFNAFTDSNPLRKMYDFFGVLFR